jgi:hypothetical protein
MTCPQEPIPLGWKVWRGPPPPAPIVQEAIHVRDHVNQYQRGTIAKTITYGGQTVGLFVSSHTWTYRNGRLVTGICIPGVSVLTQTQVGAGAPAAVTSPVGVATPDSLATPDPTAAVYGGVPPEKTDWGLVAVTAGATVVVLIGFWAAIHFTGKARLAR